MKYKRKCNSSHNTKLYNVIVIPYEPEIAHNVDTCTFKPTIIYNHYNT